MLKKYFYSVCVISVITQNLLCMQSAATEKVDVRAVNENFARNVNREIELKFSFTDEQRELLLSWLEEHAQFQGTVTQEDRYFDRPEHSFFTKNEQGAFLAESFLRVRFTPKGNYLCLKKWHKDPVTQEKTHCDEYESRVENGEAMSFLLQAEGYVLDTIVAKERTTYRIDCFEVAVDTVQGLGNFVEVELKDFSGTVEEGIAAIKKFVKNCGIRICLQQKTGYILMLKNPQVNYGVMITL